MSHQAMGYARAITMFSPDGRLLQVEYAKKTVKQGSTAIGMVCKDGVLLVTDKRIVIKLVVTEAVEKIWQIDDNVAATASGILSDARVADWADVVNNNFIPYNPPPDVFYDAYEVEETKIRNVPDMQGMYEDYVKNLNRQLSPEIVRPPVSAPAPSNLSLFRDKSQVSDSQRAAQVLRQQEMRKLLGVD